MAEGLGVTTEEAAGWRDAAARMMIPYDERLGVHPQHEGFTQHAVWDFEHTPPEHYPLLLNYPYFDLYRKQVVKQADLVLAMQLRGDAFTAEEKARNFAYYEPLTVRDSSLSACTQAVIAAEVGQLELAHDYLAEAALMDLRDVERNTRDGMHMASLAGAWLALVEGFGGMRAARGTLTFAPRLPGGISRMRFHLRYRERLIRVTVTGREATYELLEGEPLGIFHHGERLELTDKLAERKIPPIQAGPGRLSRRAASRSPAASSARRRGHMPFPGSRTRRGTRPPAGVTRSILGEIWLPVQPGPRLRRLGEHEPETMHDGCGCGMRAERGRSGRSGRARPEPRSARPRWHPPASCPCPRAGPRPSGGLCSATRPARPVPSPI